ncbi:GNAT family N-acetyltransferase [Clostridium ihumii]|uniref:GNAT family N-acetyltransferase n=1 Tax=Clostridium ihumii TaxID=1470356 RepID=UPI003D343465
MLKLNTKRLDILALNEEHLRLCINDFKKFEKNIGLSCSEKNIEDKDRNVFLIRLKDVVKNNEKYMWYTTWIIISKNENKYIGHLMIKGYPNENGEVLIGYVIRKEYRRQGYMEEVLKCIIEWIFLNNDVKSVIADTVKSNIPSQNLLKKLGMTLYKEDEECFWWRLDKL